MKYAYRNALLIVVCAVIAFVSGCAHPIKTTAMMTVKEAQIAKPHPYSVVVSAEGGRTSDSAGLLPVSNETFVEALANSIVETKLFSEVKKGEGGDYLLNINIFSLEQQPFGLDLTARMEVGWTLVNAATGKQIMRKVISSSYTATVGDAFVAIKRLRLATEGAVRKNIKEGMEQISELDF
jgi:hypothetical protein